MALTAGIAALSAGCGSPSLSTLGVYLCTTNAKNGICKASTHTLNSYAKQDFVVNAPSGFGVSAIQVTIDRKSASGAFTPYDSTQQPVGPSTASAWGPAFVWGQRTPWPPGNYRIAVKDGSVTLGTWDFTVTPKAIPKPATTG